MLDCRAVEPTERGLLRAAGGFEDVESFVRQLRALRHRWCSRRPLRGVPADGHLAAAGARAGLPPGASVLLAGRERPVGAWLALEAFRTLPLGPLEDAAALALLEHHGIRSGDAARLNRIARGHPLALMLASAGVSERPELEIEDAAMTRVVESSRGDISRTWTTRSRGACSKLRRS